MTAGERAEVAVAQFDKKIKTLQETAGNSTVIALLSDLRGAVRGWVKENITEEKVKSRGAVDALCKSFEKFFEKQKDIFFKELKIKSEDDGIAKRWQALDKFVFRIRSDTAAGLKEDIAEAERQLAQIQREEEENFRREQAAEKERAEAVAREKAKQPPVPLAASALVAPQVNTEPARVVEPPKALEIADISDEQMARDLFNEQLRLEEELKKKTEETERLKQQLTEAEEKIVSERKRSEEEKSAERQRLQVEADKRIKDATHSIGMERDMLSAQRELADKRLHAAEEKLKQRDRDLERVRAEAEREKQAALARQKEQFEAEHQPAVAVTAPEIVIPEKKSDPTIVGLEAALEEEMGRSQELEKTNKDLRAEVDKLKTKEATSTEEEWKRKMALVEEDITRLLDEQDRIKAAHNKELERLRKLIAAKQEELDKEGPFTIQDRKDLVAQITKLSDKTKTDAVSLRALEVENNRLKKQAEAAQAEIKRAQDIAGALGAQLKAAREGAKGGQSMVVERPKTEPTVERVGLGGEEVEKRKKDLESEIERLAKKHSSAEKIRQSLEEEIAKWKEEAMGILRERNTYLKKKSLEDSGLKIVEIEKEFKRATEAVEGKLEQIRRERMAPINKYISSLSEVLNSKTSRLLTLRSAEKIMSTSESSVDFSTEDEKLWPENNLEEVEDYIEELLKGSKFNEENSVAVESEAKEATRKLEEKLRKVFDRTKEIEFELDFANQAQLTFGLERFKQMQAEKVTVDKFMEEVKKSLVFMSVMKASDGTIAPGRADKVMAEIITGESKADSKRKAQEVTSEMYFLLEVLQHVDKKLEVIKRKKKQGRNGFAFQFCVGVEEVIKIWQEELKDSGFISEEILGKASHINSSLIAHQL